MKQVRLGWALLAILVLAGTLRSQDTGVSKSMHDINGQGCASCHAARSEPQPPLDEDNTCDKVQLWDCELLTRTFHTYDGPLPSSNLGSDTRVSDTEVRVSSIQCVSCHDGAATPTMSGAPSYDPAGASTAEKRLQSGHPVNIPHDPIKNSSLSGLAIVTEKVKLFGPSHAVQCSTCHDVHSSNAKFLLRTPNKDSSLCTLCHQ